ncbi:hypothetical protein GMB86_11885 [Terrilactibacillus sp. BCM23-1]|uniref:Uncharacterized protein n=1 Tax=Terrilactibacillus tamarindi TaxID=2599694 RepID=A0A6N8CTX1_9BACI|nr:hypothetical protein [Terrilactibacillus tamarindi]MTT32707.1 hypothetical protein [Terrilactibacillus tamarindi]
MSIDVSPKFQLYNVLAEENSNYHLNVEELYLYSLLNTLRTRQKVSIASIDLLHGYSPVKFFSRDKEAKQRIKKILISLKEKKVIDSPIDNTLDNKSVFTVKFPLDLKDESIGKGVKGFEQIFIQTFLNMPSFETFYVYFTIKRFDKLGGFRCDFERWGNILNITSRTAQKKIENALQEGYIYKNSGEYKAKENGEQKKQEPNIYKTTPFESKEKTSTTKKKEQPYKMDDDVKKMLDEEDGVIEGNWWDMSANLTLDDFDLYLTTDNIKLKMQAEKRIKMISKSEKGESFIRSMLAQAKENIEKEKREKEQMKFNKLNNYILLDDGKMIENKDLTSIDIDKIDTIYIKDQVNHAIYGKKIYDRFSIKDVHGNYVNTDKQAIEYAINEYIKIAKEKDVTLEEFDQIEDDVLMKFYKDKSIPQQQPKKNYDNPF